MSTDEKFWSQVEVVDAASCWPWSGRTIRGGYGSYATTIAGRRRHVIAHRFSWSEKHGPIPPGLMVCHRCDNPKCVNPSHLFLGTAVDNERDKISKGRRASTAGEASGAARLTISDVLEIRRLVNEAGKLPSEVAAQYKISPYHARDVASGRLWKSVPFTAPPRVRKPGPRKGISYGRRR